jgi:hypothetical protein
MQIGDQPAASRPDPAPETEKRSSATTEVAFACSICAEPSTAICHYCTKDTCGNHLCERCDCCVDCCRCAQS